MNNCNKCMNTRTIMSENGLHRVCALSQKAAKNCLVGKKDRFVPYVNLRELYEQYKRDWCDARGYKLEDMDEEIGINGECYACFDEWYNNEYREIGGKL